MELKIKFPCSHDDRQSVTVCLEDLPRSALKKLLERDDAAEFDGTVLTMKRGIEIEGRTSIPKES